MVVINVKKLGKKKRVEKNENVEDFSENFNCNLIDGVRINFKDGWGLIRASNTQPVLVCRCEAKNKIQLDEIKNIIFDKIKYFGADKIEFS